MMNFSAFEVNAKIEELSENAAQLRAMARAKQRDATILYRAMRIMSGDYEQSELRPQISKVQR